MKQVSRDLLTYLSHTLVWVTFITRFVSAEEHIRDVLLLPLVIQNYRNFFKEFVKFERKQHRQQKGRQ